MNSNIVIVGGGPIGLFTAIQAHLQAKQKNNKLNIIVLDKEDQYSRTQRLRIDSSSFNGMVLDDELRKIINDFKKRKFVPIQDIVTALKDYATKNGIKIENALVLPEETTYEQFAKQHKDKAETLWKTAVKVNEIAAKYHAGIIVGADGSRSVVRETIFKNDFKTNSSVEYIAQYTYDIKGKPHRTSKIDDSFESSKLTHPTYVEQSCDEKRNRVTLRFFVDKKTFDAIQEAKAKDPWTLDNNRIPEKLKKQIEQWKARRKKYFDEVEIENEANKDKAGLTSIELKIYNSRKTVIEKNGVTTCLVGDAAGGVPYFRSINKGLKEGTQLGKALAHASSDPTNPTQKISKYWAFKSSWDTDAYEGNPNLQFKAYASYAKSNAYWENLVAKIKTVFIDSFIVIIKSLAFLSPARLVDWASKKSIKQQQNSGISFSSQVSEN